MNETRNTCNALACGVRTYGCVQVQISMHQFWAVATQQGQSLHENSGVYVCQLLCEVSCCQRGESAHRGVELAVLLVEGRGRSLNSKNKQIKITEIPSEFHRLALMPTVSLLSTTMGNY